MKYRKQAATAKSQLAAHRNLSGSAAAKAAYGSSSTRAGISSNGMAA